MIACIGAGYWGRNIIRNFASLNRLSAVCDLDAERLHSLADLYPGVRFTRSIDQLFSDDAVTAVAIATPAETHGALVRRALEAGRDVFVEKPLCLSVREAEELVALAEQRERILMVGHLLWYHSAVLKLKELIDSGELGRIQYLYSNRLNLGRIRREENILWSFAPHDVSVLLGLVGEAPHMVRAKGGNYLHNRIADVTVTVLSFPSGINAHVFVSWLHPFKEQKLVVVGDRKMAVFNDLEGADKLLLYPHSILWRSGIPFASAARAEVIPVGHREPLRAECEHFVDCVLNRTVPRTDGHEGLRVLRVLDQCQRDLDRAAPREGAFPGVPGTSIHESAWIDAGVRIGEGTSIWHFTHVLTGSRIGDNCRIGQNVMIGPNVVIGNGVKIQNNVSVYEGVVLEDHVFCGPSMVFTNVVNPRSEIDRREEYRPTVVRRGASLGANCTILCGTTIGQYAFVGAGSVVLRDVPDFALVVGNPAHQVGWVCVCGHRVRFAADEGPGACTVCGQPYHKTGDQVTIERLPVFTAR